MSAACRSCGAPIRWERTVNDKPIPLDPEPVADGNLGIRDDGKVYHVGEGSLDLGEPRYKTHFATCPNATEHRKR
jgi:hypothetical protein